MIGPAGRVVVAEEDAALVARLRDGEERAFEEAVVDLYPAMFSVARGYVRTRSVAEEVVQEAWLGVLKGLDRFEGRSTLRTWVLQIVANIAQSRAVREARSLPFSSFELEDEEPAVEPERFRGADEPYRRRLEVVPDRLAHAAGVAAARARDASISSPARSTSCPRRSGS